MPTNQSSGIPLMPVAGRMLPNWEAYSTMSLSNVIRARPSYSRHSRKKKPLLYDYGPDGAPHILECRRCEKGLFLG